LNPDDEAPHRGQIDEWVFAAWVPDGSLGFVSGHRLLATHSWYWCAVVEAGRRLLHLTEWTVTVRSDPFIIKAPAMWAEHQCDEPMQQWSIGNEAYFVALDDPAEALDQAYGIPTALAIDAEWYAIGDALPLADSPSSQGYWQEGVVHGEIELLHRPNHTFAEIPARRWRRWGESLGPLATDHGPPPAGMPAPFAFPDASASQWTLTQAGWQAQEVSLKKFAR